MGQMRMKCTFDIGEIFFIWARVSQVSDVTQWPLVGYPLSHSLLSYVSELNKFVVLSLKFCFTDYVKFWINSIKTFGSAKAPVFVIGTHADDMTEEVSEVFYY
jgi:hypothetical protein